MSNASDYSFAGAGQFHELEEQVKEQSKLIEAFINSHSKHHHKSESFKVLVALYKLFMQEVQMNNELQDIIITNQSQNSEIISNVTQLLKLINGATENKFTDLTSLVLYLQKNGLHTKEQISLKKAEKKLRSQLKESNNSNKELQNINESLNDQILVLKNKNDSFENKITLLSDNLNQVTSENGQLSSTISQNSITISTMKEKICNLENEKRKLDGEIEMYKSKDKTNADLLSQFQSQINSLTTKLSQIQAMKDDLNEKVFHLETTNGLLMQTNADLKMENRENAGKTESVKKELSYIKSSSEDTQRNLESKLNILERTRKELKREVKLLREKTNAAVMKEAEASDMLKLKEAEFERRTRNLQLEIDRINAENLRMLSEIRELKNKEMEVRPRSEDSAKIAKLEQKLKSVKKISNCRKKEIEELKRDLAKQNDDCQKLLNDLTKLRGESDFFRAESEKSKSDLENLRNEYDKLKESFGSISKNNEELRCQLAVQSEQIETLNLTITKLKGNAKIENNDDDSEHVKRVRAEEELKWARRECANMQILERELGRIRLENAELQKRIEKSVRSSEAIAMLKSRLDAVESNILAASRYPVKECNQNIDGMIARFRNDVRGIRAATSVDSFDSEFEHPKRVVHLDDRVIQERIDTLRRDVDDLNDEIKEI